MQAHIKTLLDYGVSDTMVRVAVEELILATEAVQRQTVDRRVQQMIKDVLWPERQDKPSEVYTCCGGRFRR